MRNIAVSAAYSMANELNSPLPKNVTCIKPSGTVSKIMGTDAQMGVVLNIVVGIIGGLIGGFLLRGVGVNVAGAGLLFSFLTCLLGAVILLTIVKLVSRGRVR